jgi:hypothetical protein
MAKFGEINFDSLKKSEQEFDKLSFGNSEVVECEN